VIQLPEWHLGIRDACKAISFIGSNRKPQIAPFNLTQNIVQKFTRQLTITG
jgi:hypothetical protein